MTRQLFNDLDFVLTEHLSALAPGMPDALKSLITLLSYRLRQGHSCLNLDCPDWNAAERSLLPLEWQDWPQRAYFEDLFAQAASIVGRAGEFKPLIFDGNSLYFHRFFICEQHLAAWIKEHAQQPEKVVNETVLDGSMHAYFPGASASENAQAKAASLAVRHPLTLICGGPGTGKTTTVIKALRMIAEQPRVGTLRVALAAPTGKAAARLKESLGGVLPEAVLHSVGTLHRLLRIHPMTGKASFNTQAPLPLDVLVVDECSMIDLPLMKQLMEAVASETQLILLGDPDQLASVEVGSIFSDMISAVRKNPFAPAVFLEKNYRFAEDSGIGTLCACIRKGDTERAEICLDQAFTDFKRENNPQRIDPALEPLLSAWSAYFSAGSPEAALAALSSFRILCALHEGPSGVNHLNDCVTQYCLARTGETVSGRFFHRMPVLVRKNDQATGLYNGDVGVVWKQADGSMRAYFTDEKTAVRSFSLPFLPDWDTAWAMTIHRSQGSEFERVLLVLPEHDSPVLSRELIYTGLSRAKFHVTVWAKRDIFMGALGRPVARASRLAERLMTSIS